MVWRRLGKMIQWEDSDRRVSDLFYRLLVQEVLMFGLESWEVSDAMTKSVEVTLMGFLRQTM